MILNETVAAIADAIREKTGKSELIKPIDFATEIKGISAGGGSGESGGSNVEYLDVRGVDWVTTETMMMGIEHMKYQTTGSDGSKQIVVSTGTLAAFSLMMLMQVGGTVSVLAIAYNRDALFVKELAGSISSTTAYNMLTPSRREQLDALPRITKEQFYDLNA